MSVNLEASTCATFHLKHSKTVEIFHWARLFPKYVVTMATNKNWACENLYVDSGVMLPHFMILIYTLRETNLQIFMWIAYILDVFSHYFAIICCCHGNTLSPILEKVSCISKPWGQHVCYVSFKTLKNCGNISLGKIIPRVYRYHGNQQDLSLWKLVC